uniref:thrombomodulin-like n=1 Tax=Pristiophorus japonicus TaxID=55135 RepID=UPI00398EDE88
MLAAVLCLCALVAAVRPERSSPQPLELEAEALPAVCVANLCYSLLREHRKFNMARNLCKAAGGDAMTVRSSVAADAISVLLQEERGQGPREAERRHYWLGLQLHQKACPHNASRLRGYRWVDGDADTDYDNWGPVSEDCGPRCATVSRGGEGQEGQESWSDQPCNKKTDGVLCEYRYNGSCPPLLQGGAANAGGAAQHNASRVTYRTPFGGRGSDLSALPAGTLAWLGSSPLVSWECAALGHNATAATYAWNSSGPAPWDCRLQNGGCQHLCLPRALGGFSCGCPAGQLLNPDRLTCSPPPPTPADPCQDAHCQHLCLQQQGKPFCLCRDGYTLDPIDNKSCHDVDECLEQPCEQRCINRPGSFSCHCYPGYQLAADGKCADINECARQPCAQLCSNTQGSFTCTCHSRYQPDPADHTSCVFYCESRTNPCDARSVGDDWYCPVGYILNDEKKTCFDYDECDAGECTQICTNTFGSYKCDCEVGFELQEDGSTCESQGSGSGDLPTGAATIPIPTTSSHQPPRASLSLGVVLGSIFAIAVVTLIFAGLGHHLHKKRGKWQTSTKYKSANSEQEVDLSQVTSAGDHKQQCQYTEDKSNVVT